MKNKYPRFRVSQWLDTSEESMSKPEADIYYGIQRQAAPRDPWMHVSRNNEALLYKTDQEATAACAKLNESNH